MFNLLRAGVDELTPQSLPVTTELILIARWEWEPSEFGRRVSVGIEVRSLANGEVLHERTVVSDVVPQAPDASQPCRPMTIVPLRLRHVGEHAVEISVKRKPLKKIRIWVRPAP